MIKVLFVLSLYMTVAAFYDYKNGDEDKIGLVYLGFINIVLIAMRSL